MKKLVPAIAGLALFASASAFAESYSFTCADPAKLVIQNSSFYAPYDPSSGMPQNMSGTFQSISNVGWGGYIIGVNFKTIDTTKTTFASSFVSSDTILCSYNIVGTDANNNPVTFTEIAQPGNSNYGSLYAYSLSSGGTSSYDISTKIIATDL